MAIDERLYLEGPSVEDATLEDLRRQDIEDAGLGGAPCLLSIFTKGARFSGEACLA